MPNTIKIIKYPDMEVRLRKDFYAKFRNLINELFNNRGVSLFSHNIIENYRQANHKISSFGSNEQWSETYWSKFRNADPVEKACHLATQQAGVGLSSWQVLDPTSECTQERTKICNTRDGLLIAFQHGNGLIENLSFGWEKFDTNTLNLKKIELLNEMISPLRQYHLKACGLNNTKLFGEKQ
jgi:hypothetical protein